MFTIEQRNRVRDDMVAMAKRDESIIGAAFVGSSATNQQDAWSDIDLALQLAPNASEVDVVRRWTDWLYANHGIAHHLDVMRGSVRYRVFLTSTSLQIDISFWPFDEFRAVGDRFRLIFGETNPPEAPAAMDIEAVIGETWLFAVHIRSALARQQPWFALSLMDRMRDRVMMLASTRHGLNPHQRREVDQLPQSFLTMLTETRAASLGAEELSRAFAALVNVFMNEISAHDSDLAARLQAPLREITRDTLA